MITTSNLHARRLRPLLLLLPVLALGWGGCASPDPQKPDVPPDLEGACADPPAVFRPLEDGITAVGTDSTLDIATWNLEFFPLRLPGDYDCPHPVDTGRLEQLADLINLLELDVVAVQEISDPDGFEQLLDLCPGYDGYLSPEVRGCNYQRPGLLYRSDQVVVRSTRLLFTGDTFAFPRSALRADLTVTARGVAYSLNLIVVHLKASGDTESRERRRAASRILKDYLDNEAARDPDADFMIAGDWNDEIDDPLSSNSFPDFVTDPEHYQFLSTPLAGDGEFASHAFGGGSLIDHLLVNSAACPDFAGGVVTTLRLDRVLPGYGNISDHRPVLVRAPVFR